MHLRRGDRPALAAAAERVSSVAAGDVTWVRLWLAHEAWLNGDAAGALAAAHEAERQWPHSAEGPWLYQLSQLYQGLGRFDDALRLAQWMDPSLAETTRVLVAARREDWATVHRLVKAHTQSHLGVFIFAGMTREAERVLAELRRRGEKRPWQFEAGFIGQLRVAQGRFADGWILLEPLTHPEPRPRYKAFEAGALARRALGDVRGAIALLEPLGPSRASAVSYVWSVSDWLRCRTLLAELYDQVGRKQEADAVDADVRRLLAVADPGDPMIRRLDARRP
jgi:tetratricopeptide (TPR) repeat protein